MLQQRWGLCSRVLTPAQTAGSSGEMIVTPNGTRIRICCDEPP